MGQWARECPQKSSQNHKGGERRNQPRKKNEHFAKKTDREAYFCVWSPGDEPQFQGFFESRHSSMLDRIRRRREQRCSLLEKAKRLRLERNQVCGEFETMLNSCPGKGIVGTGCAKMMMGSDTFQQYLSLLSSKERASIERVLEKNRFRFGDNETRMSFPSAIIPMNIGRQVYREKVGIVASDAPFFDLQAISSADGSCSGF